MPAVASAEPGGDYPPRDAVQLDQSLPLRNLLWLLFPGSGRRRRSSAILGVGWTTLGGHIVSERRKEEGFGGGTMEQAAGACRGLCSSRFSEMFAVVWRAYGGMETEEVFLILFQQNN